MAETTSKTSKTPKKSGLKLSTGAITGIVAGAVVVTAGIIALVINNINKPATPDNNTSEATSESNTNETTSESAPIAYSGVEITEGEHTGDKAITDLAKLISDYHAKWEGGATPEGSFNKTGSFGEYFIQKYLFEGMEAGGYKIKYCDHSYTPSYPVFWSGTLGKIDKKTSVCLFDGAEYEKKKNDAAYYGIKLTLDDTTGKVTISSVNLHGPDD
ncbi:hypothetical protein IKE72_01245 [Candidatus Saccharibacteria bacterium]|nr:hypothetical protein [Candidatus Saccharibacteria bacterium]